MTEHKFTDEEVEEALKCCASNEEYACDGCPCKSKGMMTGDVCIPYMSKAAADLIKRKKEEIERLKGLLETEDRKEWAKPIRKKD